MNKSILILVSCLLINTSIAAQSYFDNLCERNNLLCFLGKDNFDWATIVAAFIGAVALILGYALQQKYERKAKNRENSKEAYLKFLNDFTEATVCETLFDDYFNKLSKEEKQKYEIESTRRKLQARNYVLLYGSNEVIIAYLNYIKHIDEIIQQKIEDKQELFFNDLLMAIRKEIYPNTDITPDDILKYFNGYNRQ
jgi:hypothetical protein